MHETDFSLSEKDIRLSIPLMKVDQERRMVHGFATLNNLDKQNDIVTKAASLDAFTRFRGNIREQHDPKKAVGRVVEFREDTMWDDETQKAYNGIFVSAYVSKGAQDTWEKVLDGTLSGFSIGGKIIDTEDAFDDEEDNLVRIVNKYDLTELSLVDNPANQLANVVSIEKMEDGTMTVETPLVKGDIENAFWCDKDGLIVLKSQDEAECSVCETKMQNIGFVESNDPQKSDIIKSHITEFKKTLENKVAKEAKNMAENVSEEELVKSSEEVSDEAEVTKAEEVEEVEAEVSDETELVEKTESVDESAESVEEEVEKTEDASEEAESVAKTDADEVIGSLVSSLSKMADTIEALNNKIDGIAKSIDGVRGDVDAVKSDVDTVKSEQEEFGKRVDSVEDTTAFRKSGDLGEVVQEQTPVKKSSVWNGAFLGVSNL